MALSRRTMTPLLGHALRALGQVDADDRRQELGRDAHGQGDGKQQGIDRRLGEKHVDGKDDQHQHGHDLREQVPEAPDAALELGLRRAQRQPLGDLAERGAGAGLHDQRACRAAAHVGAHEHHVDPLGHAGAVRRPGPAFFSTGKVSPVSTAWLTKKSLASSTIPSAGIRLPAESSTMSPGTTSSAGMGCGLPSRSTVALMVTWARSFSTAWLAVYSCAKLSTALATTMTSTMSRVGPLAGDGRYHGGKDEDEHQRAGELGEERPQRGVMPAWLQHVWPHLLQALLGLSRAQAIRCTVQFGEKVRGLAAPIGRCRRCGHRRYLRHSDFPGSLLEIIIKLDVDGHT